MVTILIMSAKLATLGLLKIKVFRNKSYDVIISIHDVTRKILSRDSNYIVDLVMKQKFVNCNISVNSNFVRIWSENTLFFRGGCCWFKFNNLELALTMALKFYISVGKGLKLKFKKFWGTNSYVSRSYKGKTVRGPFCSPSPILDRVNVNFFSAISISMKYSKRLLGHSLLKKPCFASIDSSNLL